MISAATAANIAARNAKRERQKADAAAKARAAKPVRILPLEYRLHPVSVEATHFPAQSDAPPLTKWMRGGRQFRTVFTCEPGLLLG